MTVTAFVARALDFFAAHAVHAKRLQTDNAFVYVKNASLRDLLTDRAIQHRRIPPRTPKRNGRWSATAWPRWVRAALRHQTLARALDW